MVHHREDFNQGLDRGRWVDYHCGLNAVIGNELERAVEMPADLLVHADHACACGGKFWDEGVRVLDHQVAVERKFRDRAECRHHWRPEGDIWHEMAVHHVHVDDCSASALGCGYLVG